MHGGHGESHFDSVSDVANPRKKSCRLRRPLITPGSPSLVVCVLAETEPCSSASNPDTDRSNPGRWTWVGHCLGGFSVLFDVKIYSCGGFLLFFLSFFLLLLLLLSMCVCVCVCVGG